jgi:hypothetical protein
MITDWRAAFRQPELPFLFVLLAPEQGQQALVGLWQSQLAALSLPMTAVASAIDAGDELSPQGPVHPRNKSIVGHRLSLQVRHTAYGQSAVIADGPTVRQQEITAQAQAGGSEVQVSLQYGYGTVQDNGLLILPTPGCIGCCSNGTGLLWVRLLNTTDTSSYLPLVTLNVTAETLSFSFTSAAVFEAADSSSSPPRLLIGFQSFPYPECVLYNRWLQPALPFMLQVEVDVQGGDGGGGGGYSLLQYALLAAVVLAVLLVLLLAAVWLWRRRRLAAAEDSEPLVADSRQRTSGRLQQPLMQDED